ncbi:MAG: alpha/beta hydrolase-fold protein [Steroidobacteraceae bacterium]
MNYTRHDTDAAVILTPASAPTAAVIWMHGLGADGHDFVPIVPELNLPTTLAVRFIFPHAPHRPVTLNNGYVMRAWYDIKSLGLRTEEDAPGIHASQQQINHLIQRELDAGITAQRIVIAGFSQGGAIALQTALRYPQRLAGAMPLSTYLPLRDTLAAEASPANRDLSIFMCHGRQDPVVPLTLGELSRDVLQALGYTVDFRVYDMPHSVCAEEIGDISAWLSRVLQ